MDGMASGSNDPVVERIVDLIQASETMTDAELERVVAETDPATVEGAMRVTEAMFREKTPPTNGERQSVCSTCTVNYWFLSESLEWSDCKQSNLLIINGLPPFQVISIGCVPPSGSLQDISEFRGKPF
jgi:hypothetical protein